MPMRAVIQSWIDDIEAMACPCSHAHVFVPDNIVLDEYKLWLIYCHKRPMEKADGHRPSGDSGPDNSNGAYG